MSQETNLTPQAKLIWPYLFWTFGWSWSFWLMDHILKNLWPNNPPALYLGLELLLNGLGFFGPMIAAIIVLKRRGFKSISSFIFSGRKGSWIYLLIFSGLLIASTALAAGGRLLTDSILVIFGYFIQATIVGGGQEEPGWRGFLQPALEKKFSFPVSTLLTGLIWAVWHIPHWYYDRFVDRSQQSFLLFILFCIFSAFWLAGLYKKTKSVLACNFLHALINIITGIFVGLSQAIGSLDFTQFNPFFWLGGYALLTGYSIYLWYQSDREEKLSTD